MLRSRGMHCRVLQEPHGVTPLGKYPFSPLRGFLPLRGVSLILVFVGHSHLDSMAAFPPTGYPEHSTIQPYKIMRHLVEKFTREDVSGSARTSCRPPPLRGFQKTLRGFRKPLRGFCADNDLKTPQRFSEVFRENIRRKSRFSRRFQKRIEVVCVVS